MSSVCPTQLRNDRFRDRLRNCSGPSQPPSLRRVAGSTTTTAAATINPMSRPQPPLLPLPSPTGDPVRPLPRAHAVPPAVILPHPP